MGEEKKQNLEDMFQDLEKIINEMEVENISLEKSFQLYNKGMVLLKQCTQEIDGVEKKVLILDEDGEAHEF